MGRSRAGGAGAGNITGMFASLPPTPELLAQVDALPPAKDVPDVAAGRRARRRQAFHAAQAAAAARGRADHRASPRRPRRARRAGASRAGQERHRQRRAGQGLSRDRRGLPHRAGHRAGRLAGQHRRDDGGRAERRTAPVHAARQALRPAAAARPRLLRARDVRPDHDQDDDRRGRAVLVPADRAGHHGQLGAHLLRRARRAAHHQPHPRSRGLVHLPGAGGGDAGVPGRSRPRRTPSRGKRWPPSTPTSRRTWPGCG